MNWNKLKKLRKMLVAMRRSPQKARDLEALAQKFGRRLSKRGSRHPIWESQVFALPPLPIPHHGTPPEVSIGVRDNVLKALWADYDAWAARLAAQEDDDELGGDDEDDEEDEDEQEH